MTTGVKNVYLMLMCVCDFRKNWPRIDRIFLMGLNEMPCVYLKTAWHSECKECPL